MKYETLPVDRLFFAKILNPIWRKSLRSQGYVTCVRVKRGTTAAALVRTKLDGKPRNSLLRNRCIFHQTCRGRAVEAPRLLCDNRPTTHRVRCVKSNLPRQTWYFFRRLNSTMLRFRVSYRGGHANDALKTLFNAAQFGR